MKITEIARSFRLARPLLALAPFLAACSGSQQNVDNPSGDTSGETTTSEESGDTGASKPSSPPPQESGGLNDAQREQMELVLKRGGKKAENCSESVPEGKGGEGEVKVLFDGKKGRITEVAVGTPWAGTPMESCIQRSFVGEIVLPFDGDALEVPYTIKIPEKKGAAVDPKKPGKKP